MRAGRAETALRWPARSLWGWGGISDLIVVKIASAATHVVYVTELGGSGTEDLGGMAVDALGNVLLAGRTDSADFPTTAGALREQAERGGAFVLKLDPTGRSLAFSTYLDDSYVTAARALALDASGGVYCAGITDARTFPTTTGAYMRSVPPDTDPMSRSGFVARISPDGRALAASTLFGGLYGYDEVKGLSIDPAGIVHIAGATYSRGFPTTTGAPRPAPGSPDRTFGYLARLNAQLTQLRFCTLFDSTVATAVQTDLQGNSYIAGGLSDIDVAKYDAAGREVYSKTFAAGRVNPATAVAALDDGSAVVGGSAGRPDFPTRDTLQPCAANVPREPVAPRQQYESGVGAVVMKLDAGGNLVHSSLLGGIGSSIAGMARVPDGSLYLAGRGEPPLFPAGQNVIAGAAPAPAFALKLDLGLVIRGRPAPSCLVNSATFAQAPAAPGAFATLYGSNLGPAEGAQFRLGPDGRVPAELAGVRVTVGGIPAPITYAQDTQINLLVPQGVTTNRTDICVESASGTSCLSANVRPWNQAVFRVGDGYAVLNQDGTLNTYENPADRGSVVAIWGTGFGPYAPQTADGSVAAPPLGRLAYQLRAMFPDPRRPICMFGICQPPYPPFEGEVAYAGAAPGLVNGVTQINVRLPTDRILGGRIALNLEVDPGLGPDYRPTALVWLHVKLAPPIP